MLVTILPLLLAAHVAVHEDVYYTSSDWQRYGPECTYDVLVNMSLANIIHENDNFCSMIASELKCRPKGSDTLSCRFVNGQIIRPEPDDTRCSNARNYVPINEKFVNEDPFEIRFNKKGFEIENSHDRFVVMENSSVGYCEVEVKMSRAGYGRGNGVEREGQVEIVFEPERPDLVPLNRASLRIEKVRHTKECPSRKIYFFGNHEDFSFGNKSTFMDTTSSISHMHVSHKEMYSYTESTGIMRALNRPRTMRLYQKISLSLKSINPARNSLPEIMEPASTSLYAYTNLPPVAE
ncbi:hypothetical protein ANTQUA_LOCUS3994 [Anthophora quadrimaculata]